MKFILIRGFFMMSLAIVMYTSIISYSNNGTNIMQNNTGNSPGCNCHGPSANSNTAITVSGLPNESTGYVLGQVYPITVTVTNSTKVAAGINLSVSTGSITNLGDGLSFASGSNISIKHSSPKNMINGVATYSFDWIAPNSGSTPLFLYANAIAVNNNGTTIGDAWNSYNINLPLNIDYLTFEAQSKPNQVHLQWHTSTENKIKYFAIEKSTNGIKFDSVNVMNAYGGLGIARDYEFYDYPQYSNDYFYRLKIVNDIGDAVTSKVVKVSFDNGASLESFSFPNPSAYSQIININVFNNKGKTINVSVTNTDGVTVYQYPFNAIKGTNYLRIPNRFAAGLYRISVVPDVGKQYVFKHIVQ
jgi:hypothetical protein